MTGYGQQQALATYRAQGVMSATPQQIVCMLYDHGLRSIRGAISLAATNNQPGSRSRFGRHISSALGIIGHLQSVLDRNVDPPEISDNLDQIYEFCIHKLGRANLEASSGPLCEVRDVLAPLYEAWQATCKESTVA